MTIQIRLKNKYRSGGKSKYKGGPNAAPLKNRVKLGSEKHIARFGIPAVVVKTVDGKTGKYRMSKR